MLKRVEIKAYKCLRDVSVDLGPFNVIIGPNDSGKSSFLQAVALPTQFRREVAACPPEGWVHLWSERGQLEIGRAAGHWNVTSNGIAGNPTALLLGNDPSDQVKDFRVSIRFDGCTAASTRCELVVA